MRGSFGYSLQEFKEVMDLLGEKKYQTDLIVSKKVKLENAIQEGFQELLHPDRKAAKILVEI